jgi:hypothetical protein
MNVIVGSGSVCAAAANIPPPTSLASPHPVFHVQLQAPAVLVCSSSQHPLASLLDTQCLSHAFLHWFWLQQLTACPTPLPRLPS